MSENFNIDDISNLASIELSEEEKAKLQKDLQIILEHVDALKNIDVKDEKIDIHPLRCLFILWMEVQQSDHP